MKRIRLAILLLLIPLCCVAFAALTKTTSIIVLDAWQLVSASNLDVGAAGNISDSYDTLLYLEIPYADTDAQDGVEVSIEVSYGDDNWTLLTKPFTTPAGAAQTGTFLDDGEPAGETDISLDDASDFAAHGQKWFIQDATATDSESVRTVSTGPGDTVTICQDLIREHDADTSLAWEFVHEYTFAIPAGFAYVRVLINNVDTNADIFYTTRISKVTSL